MKLFSDKLRELREIKDIGRKDLAKALNLSVSTISNYENGIRKPENDEGWQKIANYFGVTVDYLMDVDIVVPQFIAADSISADKSPIIINKSEKSSLISLPIYGEVAAGYGAHADNQIIDYMSIPKAWVSNYDIEDYVILKVSGDSMEPKMLDGDLLLVRCQPDVDNFSFAVVLIDDENGVVKRCVKGNDWIELQSLNPMYAPRRFEKEDMNRVRIFGLVKKLIRDY